MRKHRTFANVNNLAPPHGEVRLARDAVAREGSVLHAIKMAQDVSSVGRSDRMSWVGSMLYPVGCWPL